jgi:hypothetical protein
MTLDDYVKKCRQLDRELRLGRVVYSNELHMVRGNSAMVRAAVALDETGPSARLLPGSGPSASVPILVSCHVEAQLAGDPNVFTIGDTKWQSRSLLTSSTAEWYWFVTPKRGGDQTLALNVRPVVRVVETNGRREASNIVASTETFDISVTVRIPREEAAREGLDRTRSLLLAVSGVLTAIAAVVAGLLGLWRLRRRRDARAAGRSDHGDDGQPESPPG